MVDLRDGEENVSQAASSSGIPAKAE